MSELFVESALLGPEFTPSGPTRLTIADGRIAAITPAEGPAPRLLALPAFTDAHNHARPLSTTSFGAAGKPLETWLPRLAVMPPVDPYLAAAAAFGRSARGGAHAVMAHITRSQGLGPLADEVRAVARAAHDVGISIAFALGLRDQNPLVYGDHAGVLAAMPEDARAIAEATFLGPLPSIEAQLAAVDEIADAVSDAPGHVDVQYGPTGVQWCSWPLLEAIAEASARTGRRVHMHLLETRAQREWADREAPDMVQRLADIGLLSPRLTLAHCVWAREDELALITEAGARIAVNPSSNLHLMSGIADVRAMRDAGVSVAMGLDGAALDEDDDALRELRLLRLLNAGWSFDDGLSVTDALHATCVAGRHVLGLPRGGTIEVGAPADILVLDLSALDRDALIPVDLRDLLISRARQEHIVALYSGGREVVRDGALTGIDLLAMENALRAAYRAALPSRARFLAAWGAIEPAIADHYRGCG